MKNRITPEKIESLQPNEIFVFGSNKAVAWLTEDTPQLVVRCTIPAGSFVLRGVFYSDGGIFNTIVSDNICIDRIIGGNNVELTNLHQK